MSAPYPQEKGVAKGPTGGKEGQPYVEAWSSEVYFSGGGKGEHEVSSRLPVFFHRDGSVPVEPQ